MSVRNYAILYGGKSKSSVSTLGGGNALLTTGQHALDGPEHTSTSDIATLDASATAHGLLPKLSGTVVDALRGDGTFGPTLRGIEGGQDPIKAHGSMGATETFDPTDGNVHTGTLNANCTFTLNAPTGSGACTLEMWIGEDSTGGWAVTWPGSVTEQGTHDTTLGTTQRVILETITGGSAWIATWIGGGSTVAALDDLSDVQTSGEVAGAMLVYDGAVWRPGAPAEPLILEDGTIAILENGHAAMAEPTYL